MSQRIKKVVFLLLTLVGCFFFYLSYQELKKGDEQYQFIQGIDDQVIHKLSIGRDLQLHYLATHGEFTPSWDSLFDFVRTGTIYTVQETEIIEKSAFGDRVRIERDTIGRVAAYDSLRNRMGKIALKDIEQLKYSPSMPGTDSVIFEMSAGKVKDGPVFEIIDPKPINPKRQLTKAEGGLPALRVGSMKNLTSRGNWEY